MRSDSFQSANMNLIITRAGILDTIQDKGRFGFRHLGINTGGVMDQAASTMANSLVGNDFEEAVIEMHFPAAEFLFTQPALIAIGGADFSATVNGKAIPNLHPVFINSQSVLRFKKNVSGARAYLAVQGGFNVSKWLNSYSTNLQIGAGGYHGRRLVLNDRLSYHFLRSIYNEKKRFPGRFCLRMDENANRNLVEAKLLY